MPKDEGQQGELNRMNIETAGGNPAGFFHWRYSPAVALPDASPVPKNTEDCPKEDCGVLEVCPVCQEDDAKASAASEPLSFAHEAEGWQGKGGYPKLKAQYIFAKKWIITYYYCIQHLH